MKATCRFVKVFFLFIILFVLFACNQKEQYLITWVDEDGTLIYSEEVTEGEMPVYNEEEPVKPHNDDYVYLFSNWSPEVVIASEDATYYVVYETIENSFTITWLNEDGSLLEQDEDLSYLTMPTYNGETPQKDRSDTIYYEFSSWTPEVTPITGDQTYYAVYLQRNLLLHEIMLEAENGNIQAFEILVEFASDQYDHPEAKLHLERLNPQAFADSFSNGNLRSFDVLSSLEHYDNPNIKDIWETIDFSYYYDAVENGDSSILDQIMYNYSDKNPEIADDLSSISMDIMKDMYINDGYSDVYLLMMLVTEYDNQNADQFIKFLLESGDDTILSFLENNLQFSSYAEEYLSDLDPTIYLNKSIEGIPNALNSIQVMIKFGNIAAIDALIEAAEQQVPYAINRLISTYIEFEYDLIETAIYRFVDEEHPLMGESLARYFSYNDNTPTFVLEILKYAADQGKIEAIKLIDKYEIESLILNIDLSAYFLQSQESNYHDLQDQVKWLKTFAQYGSIDAINHLKEIGIQDSSEALEHLYEITLNEIFLDALVEMAQDGNLFAYSSLLELAASLESAMIVQIFLTYPFDGLIEKFVSNDNDAGNEVLSLMYNFENNQIIDDVFSLIEGGDQYLLSRVINYGRTRDSQIIKDELLSLDTTQMLEKLLMADYRAYDNLFQLYNLYNRQDVYNSLNSIDITPLIGLISQRNQHALDIIVELNYFFENEMAQSVEMVDFDYQDYITEIEQGNIDVYRYVDRMYYIRIYPEIRILDPTHIYSLAVDGNLDAYEIFHGLVFMYYNQEAISLFNDFDLSEIYLLSEAGSFEHLSIIMELAENNHSEALIALREIDVTLLIDYYLNGYYIKNEESSDMYTDLMSLAYDYSNINLVNNLIGFKENEEAMSMIRAFFSTKMLFMVDDLVIAANSGLISLQSIYFSFYGQPNNAYYVLLEVAKTDQSAMSYLMHIGNDGYTNAYNDIKEILSAGYTESIQIYQLEQSFNHLDDLNVDNIVQSANNGSFNAIKILISLSKNYNNKSAIDALKIMHLDGLENAIYSEEKMEAFIYLYQLGNLEAIEKLHQLVNLGDLEAYRCLYELNIEIEADLYHEIVIASKFSPVALEFLSELVQNGNEHAYDDVIAASETNYERVLFSLLKIYQIDYSPTVLNDYMGIVKESDISGIHHLIFEAPHYSSYEFVYSLLEEQGYLVSYMS